MLCVWILHIIHKYYQPLLPPTTSTPYPEKNLYLILRPHHSRIPRKKLFFQFNLYWPTYSLWFEHISYIYENTKEWLRNKFEQFTTSIYMQILHVYIYITWITYKNFMKARSTIFGTICDYDRKLYGNINIR